MTAEVHRNGRLLHIAIEGVKGMVLARLMTILIGKVGIEPLVAIAKAEGGNVGVGQVHVVKTSGICQGIV
jgi:hypothetical protein